MNRQKPDRKKKLDRLTYMMNEWAWGWRPPYIRVPADVSMEGIKPGKVSWVPSKVAEVNRLYRARTIADIRRGERFSAEQANFDKLVRDTQKNYTFQKAS